jgi:GDP-L-fucose synthase
MMDKEDRIYVSGHRGLAGSAICRALSDAGFEHLVTRTRQELDLTDQSAVNEFFDVARPDYVFLAAARVGGIVANETFPAEFIRENLLLQTHIIDAAHRFEVRKLVFLGSNCIYPRECAQPVKEGYLMTGPLEPTNSAYAVAKIAGVEMCRAYRRQYGFNTVSAMPCNLYGPHDNFNLIVSHAMPGLIRKFHEAKATGANQVLLWGTGRPRREFMHADDMARAAVFLMQTDCEGGLFNVGTGEDITIREVAALVADVVQYDGEIVFDTSKPDGTLRKVLDVSQLMELGWRSRITLREGITSTYAWYQQALCDPRLAIRL